MSDENAPAEETTPSAEAESDEVQMPSWRKQVAVMAIIVVAITIVLGGGVLISSWLG
jgi:flagellar basal body-associated protein FliL